MQQSTAESPLRTIAQVIRAELALSPGRAALIARIVFACTLVMLLVMVFRIPGAALGAYYPLLMLRDSPRETARAATRTGVACTLAAAEVILGAALFAGSPPLHFFWVAGNLFGVFYLVSSLTMYDAALAAGLFISNAIAIWDRPTSPEDRVTLTLFTLLSILLASAVSMAVAYVFRPAHPSDGVLPGIRQRLRIVSELLEDYAGSQEDALRLTTVLSHLATKGTGALRERLAHATYEPGYKERLATALALSGKLVELAANLYDSAPQPSEQDRARCRSIAASIADIETSLERGEAPGWLELPFEAEGSVPLLNEMERNIDLIAQTFSDEQQAPHYHLPEAAGERKLRLFAKDALRGRKHLRFAIRGSLSALACYLLYMSVGWTGLNASIATCILTALPHTGGSRHKQLLRFAGMLVGSCVLGFGAQALILPQIDSLFSFAFVFACVIAFGAWVGTSGPRIAYAGAQIVLAYDLVNLSRFGINPSLITARDTVLGILLGIAAMWLIFDHLWATPSTHLSRGMLLRSLRDVASFAPGAAPESAESERRKLFAQAERMNARFNRLRNIVDVSIFESFPKTQEDTILIGSIRTMLPQLRSYLLLKIGLFQHQLVRGTSSTMVEEVQAALTTSSDMLLQTAQVIQGDCPDAVPLRLEAQARLRQMRAAAKTAALQNDSNLLTETRLCSSLLEVAIHIESNARCADQREAVPVLPQTATAGTA